MKVLLITDPLPAAPYVAALRELAPDLQVTVWQRDLLPAEWQDADVVLGWRLPAGVAGALPRLRWVCSIAAGVEKLLVPDLPANVPMSRIVDPDQALGIAQYVAMMALRHLRELPRYEAQQAARSWDRHPMAAARDSVAVLGMGETGREIARVLESLGLTVRGWSRSSGLSLADVLRDARIVVCALPLTAQTEGLLDARALGMLPRGSYLINVARGAHVVEADLIQAIESGQLAGAALDVQAREPLPADSPLWAVPGVTITPHIAAQSSLATIARQFLDGLAVLQAGAPLSHQVDRGLGY